MERKAVIGYTAGVYDLFHIGHLNMLRNARSLCDKLIVGVTTDELVSYKGKKSIIPFHERIEIVRNIKCVDAVVPQESMDKMDLWNKLKYDIMFVGDDWYGTEKWIDTMSSYTRNVYKEWWSQQFNKTEKMFRRNGIDQTSISTEEDYVKPLMKLFKSR